MKPFARRLLTLLGLGILELTPPALLLTLWGAPGAWAALVVTIFAAYAVHALIVRIAPLRWQRPLLALATLPLALLVVAAITSVGDPVVALLDLTAADSFRTYAGFVAGLYTAWRGIRLSLYEQVGLRELFARAMGTSLLALLFGGNADPALLTAATGELVLGFAVGLGTVALARAAEPGETSLRAAGWRGATPTVAAIGAVLLVGLGLVALFGNEARGMLIGLGELLLLLMAALILPIAFLLLPLVEWLLRAIHAPELMKALQDFTQGLERRQLQNNPFTEMERSLPWLGPTLEWIGRIMPVLTILALIWFVARRRKLDVEPTDEERVSLFSWGNLADDLADLLARLRQHSTPGGLQAALARLQANDPDTRIRRSYVRMLLAAEGMLRPRSEPQTPREYLPVAQTVLPGAPQALDALTAAYEQARYAPGSASEEQATSAEAAWSAIQTGSNQGQSSK